MSKRVLVTGGAGFVGSHVCERLVEHGYQTWIVDDFGDDRASARKRRNISHLVDLPPVHLVEGDVRDSVLLSGLISDVSFAAVIHLASHSPLARQVNGPESCEVSVRATLRLLEAMRRHSVHRLVLGSSTSVYGESEEGPLSEEDADGRPKDLDGAASRASELLAHAYHAKSEFSVHCLRLSTVYGPGQHPEHAPHRYARLLDIHGTVGGDGVASVRRGHNYIYVGDVADAVRRSLEVLRDRESSSYEVFNITGPDCVSESVLVSRLAAALGIEPEPDPTVTAPDDAVPPTGCASGDRALSVLEFEPQVRLDEGLAEFAKWYRDRDHASSVAPSVVGALPEERRNGGSGPEATRPLDSRS